MTKKEIIIRMRHAMGMGMLKNDGWNGGLAYRMYYYYAPRLYL